MTRRLAALAALASVLLCAPEAIAGSIELRAETATPVVLAGQMRTVVLKVGLRGLDIADSAARAPINLAIVLDKSGSMAGEKLEKAKTSALHLLDRLRPDDLVSVVAYDGRVRMLVPATRVSERRRIAEAILGVQAHGSTALFAGVSKGVGEVRKFLRQNQVNRVILLSDGKANVGPSSPNALGRLGAACAKERIAITTVGLGLGYNEDLMVQLAMRSDGNHAFAADASDLERLFAAELGDITSVVAQGALVRIDLAPGVRPMRVLNREAMITGRTITYTQGQVYGGQEKFVLIEAEVGPGVAGADQPLATVTTTYLDLLSGQSELDRRVVALRFTDSVMEADAAMVPSVLVAHTEAIANERNRLALDLRDRGEVLQAQRLLQANSDYLDEAAARYASPKLKKQALDNSSDAKNLDAEGWNRQRKVMRKRQYELDVQQSF
ncbi:MAG: VWA domain-containing protein [Myxococcales bacterium]|nr:VWA domain-containing protein [Myxococcales bacterium]